MPDQHHRPPAGLLLDEFSKGTGQSSYRGRGRRGCCAVAMSRQIHRQHLAKPRQQRQLRGPMAAPAGPAVYRHNQYATTTATGNSQVISVYFKRFKLHGHSPLVTCYQEKVVFCYRLAKLSMVTKKRNATLYCNQ